MCIQLLWLGREGEKSNNCSVMGLVSSRFSHGRYALCTLMSTIHELPPQIQSLMQAHFLLLLYMPSHSLFCISHHKVFKTGGFQFLTMCLKLWHLQHLLSLTIGSAVYGQSMGLLSSNSRLPLTWRKAAHLLKSQKKKQKKLSTAQGSTHQQQDWQKSVCYSSVCCF